MHDEPLVSIAICVYNGEKYLIAQLDSIISQSYKNIEIIAVDDCSSDSSRLILENYAKIHSNLKVYKNELNLGYVKNFEKAILLCKGKFIALSDQDDLWHPEKISRQVSAIGDNILIYHDSEFVDEEGLSLNKKMSDLVNFYEGDSPLPFVFMNCVSGHTVMFERELIKYALPFNPGFFHDWWLAFVAANVGSIKVIPLTLVKYRQHPASTIDFLQLKGEPLITTNELLLKKEWVKLCSKYSGNYSKYLIRIHSLISSEASISDKIKLYLLLAKNRKNLHYASKSPVKRQLKVIRRLVFSMNKIAN